MEKCSLCASSDVMPLIDFGYNPIAHNYLDNPEIEEAVYLVDLWFCNNCGLFFLHDPIPPTLLYKDYFTLSSWKHQPHIPRLIEIIEQKTKVSKSARILEVGSNDGRFLYELQENGYSNLTGMEPANDACESAKNKGIETIQTYFDAESADRFAERYGKCDLFISRQMLEHVGNLQEFAVGLKKVLIPGGYAVIEVPNFTCNLDNLDYTLWEEHINYFTGETLEYFFSVAGLEIIHSEISVFSGEALTMVGFYSGSQPRLPSSEHMSKHRRNALEYRSNWDLFRKTFIGCLREERNKGKKMALYGAGARLCSLVNFTGAGSYFECVVDDQPEKQGLYLPGSRLPILPSSALKEKNIDVCFLAVNTECEEIVIAKHADYMGVGQFTSVLPPSKRLPDFWKELILDLVIRKKTMKTTLINEEVYFCDEVLPKVSQAEIRLLKEAARNTLRCRARLCTHSSTDDHLHEMFIVHARNTYVRPHRHLNKAESICVIEGNAELLLFNDNGEIVERIKTGDYASGDAFYMRIPDSWYHSLLIKSDQLVFLETTEGPFVRDNTQFAPWAPEDGGETVAGYLARLSAG